MIYNENIAFYFGPNIKSSKFKSKPAVYSGHKTWPSIYSHPKPTVYSGWNRPFIRAINQHISNQIFMWVIKPAIYSGWNRPLIRAINQQINNQTFMQTIEPAIYSGWNRPFIRAIKTAIYSGRNQTFIQTVKPAVYSGCTQQRVWVAPSRSFRLI